MTRRTRRCIFYTFLFLFVVLASSIILYAQGYSFDWQKKSPVITGAFYFKSYPKEADIYINNKYEGKTTKFIRRLPPGKYDIKISKQNYSDWQKTLAVESKLVTEVQDVVLVKKTITPNLITDNNVKYLTFSLDKKRAIYLTDSPPALRLIDLTNGTDIQIYPLSTSTERGYTASLPSLNSLSDILWSPNGERLILSFANNRYYILNLKNPIEIIDIYNLIKILSTYKLYSIENLSFHSQNADRIYFYFKNNLYFIEINNSNPNNSLISPPIVYNALTYVIYNDKILYVDTNGEFYKTSLNGSSFKKIFDIPVFKPGQSISIINEEILALDKSLYLLNSQAQVFDKISENIEEIVLSDDRKKMLWRTQNEIGIMWLEPEIGPVPRNRYETEIIKTARDITQAIWYTRTNQHVIIVAENKIEITELDNRSTRNTADIIMIQNPRTFYNETNDTFYILSNGKLYRINPID
jgi:WD40 repeat protein